MEPKRRKYLNIAALVLLGSAAGLTVGQRWVGASPAGNPDAITFSGYLEESGQPVTGKRDIGLQFYDDAAGASEVCPESISSTDVADGYFSVTASSACVDGLRRQRSAWCRLSVGGTKLPLTRVPTTVFRSEPTRAEEAVG